MSVLKLAVPAILALLAVGCVDLVEKEELDDLTHKVEKLSAQVAQKNDMQALLYEELVKRANGLEKKVGEMDIAVNTMKAQVARLEDLAKTMRAEIDALGKAPAQNPQQPGQPATETSRALKIEDILLEVETVVTQLRGGKLRTGEAAARIVGATKDKELSKILEEHLGDPDEDVRLNVGDALVACRNSSGIPLLLQCLRSDQNSTRTIAIAALKKVNRGEDLGYRPSLTVEANAAAIKSWEEWSDKFAKTLFE